MTTIALLIALAMPVESQTVVYCTKIGVLNGPVVMFERNCPIGWRRVY